MDIAKQIKEQRTKHGLTQEQLAEILSVSRSTISSWEVNRNYPDLETLVAISELFQLSLDDLIKGDQKMLEQITNDTKKRKTNKKIIRNLTITIITLLIIGIYIINIAFPQLSQYVISDPTQITSINLENKQLRVNTNLPKYKSVIGYVMNPDQYEDNVVEIRISGKWDFSFNNQNDIIADINFESIKDITKIKVVDNDGNVLKDKVIKP